jgi:hypothetical protein
MTTIQWTIVQHSGFGYTNNPEFEAGLETRQVSKAGDRKRVQTVGGLLFDSYEAAEKFADEAMYPPGTPGLIPQAPGAFTKLMVDGLAIYLPPVGAR